jgi:hypothetical protein
VAAGGSVRLPLLTALGADVGERTEVSQLAGIDHRPDHAYLSARDVQDQGADQAASRVEEQRAGLTVDLDRADRRPQRGYLPAEGGDQAADLASAGDRARPRRAAPSPQTTTSSARRVTRPSMSPFAVADGGEEPGRELLPLAPRHLESRPVLGKVAAAAQGQLAWLRPTIAAMSP